MSGFQTILLPVTFSERCRGAARYAEALARHSVGRIVLLHVIEAAPAQPADVYFGGMTNLVDLRDWTDRASKMLARFRKEELQNAPVEERIETGDPATVITEIAASLPADLIVMPTHGYGRFRRFILGSVTAKVLHDSERPIWTGAHLEDAPPRDSIRIQNIVCGLDLQDATRPALAAAAALAADFRANLTLVHAVPGSDALPERVLDRELRADLVAQARESLRELAADENVNASICVQAGEPAAAVRTAAQSHNADLVVIGRGHQKGLGRLRTHSYAIIRESPCPVLSL